MNLKSLLAILFLFTFYNHAWAEDCGAGPLRLEQNKWTLIALPCAKNPLISAFYSVGEVFGGALGPDEYTKRWVVFSWNGRDYVEMPLNGGLTADKFLLPGIGYWIIQVDKPPLNVHMPTNSIATATPTVSNKYKCGDNVDTRCIDVTLKTISGGVGWNMLGNPYSAEFPVADLRIQSTTGDLVPPGAPDDIGSSLKDAQDEEVFNAEIFSYDPDGGVYKGLIGDNADKLSEWQGFWGATLKRADNPNDPPIIKFPIK